MSIESEFRDKVEAYLERTETGATEFGIQTLGDPGFIRELRGGRSPQARTMDKILAWMDQHPDGAQPAAKAKAG